MKIGMTPRLLPLVMIAAALALTLRIGSLWPELSGPGVAAAEETRDEGASESAEQDMSDLQAEDPMAPQQELAASAADPFALTDTEIEVDAEVVALIRLARLVLHRQRHLIAVG